MRLCLYTETALPTIGGQELVVDALAREYTNQGHEVVVLAPTPRGSLVANDRQLPYRMIRHRRFLQRAGLLTGIKFRSSNFIASFRSTSFIVTASIPADTSARCAEID